MTDRQFLSLRRELSHFWWRREIRIKTGAKMGHGWKWGSPRSREWKSCEQKSHGLWVEDTQSAGRVSKTSRNTETRCVNRFVTLDEEQTEASELIHYVSSHAKERKARTAFTSWWFWWESGTCTMRIFKKQNGFSREHAFITWRRYIPLLLFNINEIRQST